MIPSFVVDLSRLVDAGTAPSLIVHSDVFEARRALPHGTPSSEMAGKHLEMLGIIAGGRTVLIPTFNYDFTRTGVHDQAATQSQVGPLTEYARLHWATWRGGPPVFHFCGNVAPTPVPPSKGRVDPFAEDSVFGWVRASGGDVLLYGAPFASLTAIHHVERISGGPVYRYDKTFSGISVGEDGVASPVELLYHVRPMGLHLEYDWARLENDARRAGLIESLITPGARASLVHLRELSDYWVDRMRRDPLYLLEGESRTVASSHLDRLGRRFLLDDFELASEDARQ